MAEDGVKEIIVIAQDTTRYGIDIYDEYAPSETSQRALQDRRDRMGEDSLLLSGACD